MTRAEVVKALGHEPEDAAPFDAFVKEMANRHYDDEPTEDAWLWFLVGWTESEAQP